MKKFILLLLCLLLCTATLFAYPTNQQKIYSLESDLYEAIMQLYIMTGHALPSSAGPYSAAELIGMINKIDRASLPTGGEMIYDYVIDEINATPKQSEDMLGLKFTLVPTLEVYAHSNTTDEAFLTRFNWQYGLNNMKPFLNIALETWPVTSFYGYSEIVLQNSTRTSKVAEFGSTPFQTNIPGYQDFASGFKLDTIDLAFPFRAFVAAGGDHWSVQLGRDRISWGSGVSGNLMVGDHLRYHNQARFTTFFNSFKYTFLTSFFPHPQSYFTGEAGQDELKNHGIGYTESIQGISMFMAHRLEGRFFNDRLGFTLNEAMMYQQEDGALDLQVFNPAMFYHNYYFFGNSNSLLGFELDYTPWKYFNIYGQIVIDEIAFGGEDEPGKAKSARPSANGYIAGIKGNYPTSFGLAYASFEVAKTDPFLYLRYFTSDDQNNENFDKFGGISYIVAIRNFSNGVSGGNIDYDRSAIGYKWGNDTLTFNLNAGFKQYGKWNVAANAFFMIDGTYDINTIWNKVTNEAKEDPNLPVNPSGPTTSTEGTNSYDKKDANYANRNAAALWTILTLKGSYNIIDNLDVYGQLDYINIVNPGNDGKKPAISDVQFTMGVTYTY